MSTRSMCVLCLLTATSVTPAAESTSATIETTGDAEVVLTADVMQLEVDVYSEADDLRDAILLLHERRKAAEELALQLGARPESIAFEAPKIESQRESLKPVPDPPPESSGSEFLSPTTSDDIDGNSDGDDSPLALSPATEVNSSSTVMVSARLGAAFQLTDGTADDKLIQISELQNRINVVDLSGIAELRRSRELKSAKGLSAPDQPCLCGLGQPHTSLVCNLSERDRQLLISGAIARAKKNAADLAAAVGLTLGPVEMINLGPIRKKNVGRVPDDRSLPPDPQLPNQTDITHTVVVTMSYSLEQTASLSANARVASKE